MAVATTAASTARTPAPEPLAVPATAAPERPAAAPVAIRPETADEPPARTVAVAAAPLPPPAVAATQQVLLAPIASPPPALAPVPVKAPAPTLSDEFLRERHRAARERADALLHYLSHPQAAAPPIWGNGHSLDAADAIRSDLANGELRDATQLLRTQAHWQINADEARIAVPVATPGQEGARTLHAGLRWKDDAWWVESLSLDEGAR